MGDSMELRLNTARQSARNRAQLEQRAFAIYQHEVGTLTVRPAEWEKPPTEWTHVETVEPPAKN